MNPTRASVKEVKPGAPTADLDSGVPLSQLKEAHALLCGAAATLMGFNPGRHELKYRNLIQWKEAVQNSLQLLETVIASWPSHSIRPGEAPRQTAMSL